MYNYINVNQIMSNPRQVHLIRYREKPYEMLNAQFTVEPHIEI